MALQINVSLIIWQTTKTGSIEIIMIQPKTKIILMAFWDVALLKFHHSLGDPTANMYMALSVPPCTTRCSSHNGGSNINFKMYWMHSYKQNRQYPILIKIEKLFNQCATTKGLILWSAQNTRSWPVKRHLSSITWMVSRRYICAINGSCWNKFMKSIHT